MIKTRRRRQWRRRYDYPCRRCGKMRYTVVYGRKQQETCTRCETSVPDNQMSLIDYDQVRTNKKFPQE